MESGNRWKRGIALVGLMALAGVGVACGDDEAASNADNQSNNQPNNQDPNNQPNNQDPNSQPNNQAPNNQPNNQDDPFPDVDPVDCAYPSDDAECDEDEDAYGPATFLREFSIETERSGDEQCCFDLDGSGEIDNFVGETLVSLATQIDGFENINDNIQVTIESGELSYLFEMSHWEHPQWDESARMSVYQGGTVQGDYLGGEGEFYLPASNFSDDGNPLFGFGEVQIIDGELQASDGFVEVSMPGLLDELAFELANAEMRADVVQDPEPDLTAGGSFSLSDGELGGVILRDNFYKNLNAESLLCDCLDLDLPDDFDPDDPDLWSDGLFRYIEGQVDDHPGRWTCDGKTQSGDACLDPSEPVECQTLGDSGVCSVLGIISDDPDVKVDGEWGFSIGARFESVPATLMGEE